MSEKEREKEIGEREEREKRIERKREREREREREKDREKETEKDREKERKRERVRENCYKVRTWNSKEISDEPETTCKQHTVHWTNSVSIFVSFQSKETLWKNQN